MAPEQQAIQNTIKLTHFPLLPCTNKPLVLLIQLLKAAYTQCTSGKARLLKTEGKIAHGR